ncbi:hypothetical protein FB45DRAFT_903403, partial [Roridomyces roridus]
MAKSTRSKVKRSFRSVKRTEGVYAAVEAARLNRLHAKLSQVASRSAPRPEKDEEEMDADAQDKDLPVETLDESLPGADSMQVDADSSKKISTHGPRNSRRDEWRNSKGLVARPSKTEMNRQGGVAGTQKGGQIPQKTI